MVKFETSRQVGHASETAYAWGILNGHAWGRVFLIGLLIGQMGNGL